MYKRIKTSGVTDPLTMGVILTAVIFAGAVLYFMLTNKPVRAPRPADQAAQEYDVNASPVPTISDSDEIEVMEEELDSIDAGSVDEDIESLEQEASSL